jgi:hypothetical protein
VGVEEDRLARARHAQLAVHDRRRALHLEEARLHAALLEHPGDVRGVAPHVGQPVRHVRDREQRDELVDDGALVGLAVSARRAGG